MADQNQGYPGHCDPPGSLVANSVVFAVLAALLVAIGVFVLRTVMFAFAIAFVCGSFLSLSGIRESIRVCKRHGGGICPSCGDENEVRWYS